MKAKLSISQVDYLPPVSIYFHANFFCGCEGEFRRAIHREISFARARFLERCGVRCWWCTGNSSWSRTSCFNRMNVRDPSDDSEMNRREINERRW